ncbi:MAG: hypothetical protein ACYCQJ_07595 [Nitrososphaerales archaeon]
MRSEVILPFFPYEDKDHEKQVAIAREKYRERGIEHKLKFSAFWKKNIQSRIEASSRSKRLIERSIEQTRARTRQFVFLARIDQSIIRERTREHLDYETRRITEEMLSARKTVLEVAGSQDTEKSLKSKMERARKHVWKRASEIQTIANSSADGIIRQREGIRGAYKEIFQDAQKKIIKSKERLEIAQRLMQIEVEDKLKQVVVSENKIKNERNLFTEKASSSERLAEQTRNMEEADSLDVQIKHARARVKQASDNFKLETESAKIATDRAGQAAIMTGRSSLKRMHENLLQSKTLFEVDVRFAQNKIRETSKKSKRTGVQMTLSLANRRKSAIARARARRKAQAIRNALTLIHSVG